MGTLTSFLSGFSGSFKAALLIWPALSFALTLPILAYLYHRDGRLRFGSALSAYLAVLYIAGLGCFTLYPLPSGTSGPGITYGIPPQLDPLNFINDIRRDGLTAVFQLLFNVVLFMPLGFIARRFLRLGLPITALLSLATTGLIETAQLTGLFGLYPFAYRTFEVDDLICNTLGGILGWLCARILDSIAPEAPSEAPEITRHPGFLRRAVAFWLDCLIMGAVALGPWLALSLASEFWGHRSLALGNMDAAQTESALVILCALGAFLIVEVLIPWLHRGSTPGGSFVRMTVETKARYGGRRILFYLLRSITLALFFLQPGYATLLLALFYLIARQMPYDLLPSSPIPA